MPGVRSKDQTLVGCWCSESFVKKIDHARGEKSMSQFCREALREKLESVGIDVTPEESRAPDRAGKGGPKAGRTFTSPVHSTNEVSSKSASVRSRLLKKASASVQKLSSK
jgi:hypothetical protein